MSLFLDRFSLFANAFLFTLQFCLLAAVGALLVGVLIAALRVSPLRPLRLMGTAYVNFFRNVPLAVVLFLSGFTLPAIGVTNADFLRVPGLTSIIKPLETSVFFRLALIGMVLYTGAFACEALRAGINAVPVGQAEAARSLGFTFIQNLRHIVLPQAWRYAIVPIGTVIIAMIKNSALVAAFGVGGDLMATADILVSQESQDGVVVFTIISIGYLCVTIPLSLLLDAVERRRAETLR